MNLCSKGHDEICFVGSDCPACEIIEEKDNEIEKLQYRVTDLENEIKYGE